MIKSSNVKVLVVGSGRMGIRHCLGVLNVPAVKELVVCDILQSALENAEKLLNTAKHDKDVSYMTYEDICNTKLSADIAIVAATAGNRLKTCRDLVNLGIKYFLVEKPLGQSMEEVNKLVDFFSSQKEVKAFVNLNTRLYPGYQKLKKDLAELPQFAGALTFSISTGTVGIGANGIHYIDLIKFLTDATTLSLEFAKIDDTAIPSGRGPEFCDFGGYAVLNYLDSNGIVKAKAFLVLGSQSTAFGPWEIVGKHGRILIDELEQVRANKYRNPESLLPIQRYAGDYLPMSTEKFEVPMLNDLTELFLNELVRGKEILPRVDESIAVHKAVFDWLNAGKLSKDKFPIT